MGLMDALPGIGAIGNMAGGLISGISGAITNAENLKTEKEQQAWERKAQETTWEREDNAVQRRTEDMKKAGLNPVLAAGGAAQASAPIHTVTPHANPLPDMGKPIGDATQTYLALAQAKQDIQISDGQRRLLDEQIAKAKEEVTSSRLDNMAKKWNMGTRMDLGLPTDQHNIVTDIIGGLKNKIMNRAKELMNSLKRR